MTPQGLNQIFLGSGMPTDMAVRDATVDNRQLMWMQAEGAAQRADLPSCKPD